MAVLSTRQKLISYLANAEESKVNAVYTLLENDIVDHNGFVLSEDQLAFLKEERIQHLQGLTKSYSRDESIQIVRGQRDF